MNRYIEQQIQIIQLKLNMIMGNQQITGKPIPAKPKSLRGRLANRVRGRLANRPYYRTTSCCRIYPTEF